MYKKWYRLNGEKEPDGFRNLITGIIDTSQLRKAARDRGISVTAFLSAVMIECIINI